MTDDVRLTATDPEPPIGTMVVDDLGRRWLRFDHDGRCWIKPDEDDDTETWIKVAGNYGPVTILTKADE